jgi:hypothetical protein
VGQKLRSQLQEPALYSKNKNKAVVAALEIGSVFRGIVHLDRRHDDLLSLTYVSAALGGGLHTRPLVKRFSGQSLVGFDEEFSGPCQRFP